MSQSLRTSTMVPLSSKNLNPCVPQKSIVSSCDLQRKISQKENFDKRHGARPMTRLQIGDSVWVPDRQDQGTL